MTTKEHKATYTKQQAEELDRALEAQYRADECNAPPAREYAEWQKVRRAAAQRRFERARHARQAVERWPQRGEIWWVETPNQPHDPDTPRVALVVSENRRNYHKDDYIVVPAFSRGNLGPTRVFLPEGQGGIDHDSILFCDEVCCLDADLLDFETGPLGGQVDGDILAEVVLKIRRAVGDVVPLQPGEEYPNLSFE